MDFEDNNHQFSSEMDTEMIPIIPSSYAEETNYPTSASMNSNHQNHQSGFKSVSTSKMISSEQQAALEDPNEKDILELLQQMDDFEPVVRFSFNPILL